MWINYFLNIFQFCFNIKNIVQIQTYIKGAIKSLSINQLFSLKLKLKKSIGIGKSAIPIKYSLKYKFNGLFNSSFVNLLSGDFIESC